jgi:hypothetical protein
MVAEQLIETLERDGIRLRADSERLKLEAPADRIPNEETLAGLRQNRAGILACLRARTGSSQFSSLPEPRAWKTGKQNTWPVSSVEAETQFCQPHAKLFPFIGRKVRTPKGVGTLIQAFAAGCTVLLDSDLLRCARFASDDIEPASWELP